MSNDNPQANNHKLTMSTQELVNRLYKLEQKATLTYEEKITVQITIETIRVALDHMKTQATRIQNLEATINQMAKRAT